MLAQAEAIADLPPDAADVRVTVRHVFEENPKAASVAQVGAVRRVREYLADADTVEVDLAEASGDPAEKIVARAEDLDARRICVAGRKRTPTGKVLFGSVTQAVVLNTDRPVLVCGEGDE